MDESLHPSLMRKTIVSFLALSSNGFSPLSFIELHNAFDHYHWTGFYRTTSPGILKIGPYQGGHGCLVIAFENGICGAAARTGKTQNVPNVHDRSEHIACSSTTNSEIVVPIKNSKGKCH